MNESTVYTIGTALRRAQDRELPVLLLVEGQWLEGVVAAMDGHGVVLNAQDDEHSVVRMTSISAVRVLPAVQEPAPAAEVRPEPESRPRQDSRPPEPPGAAPHHRSEAAHDAADTDDAEIVDAEIVEADFEEVDLDDVTTTGEHESELSGPDAPMRVFALSHSRD